MNWSALARKHGISTRNGGQSVKEFLRDQGVTAAMKCNSNTTTKRRQCKRLLDGIPFPMPRPSEVHKQQLSEQMELDKSILGNEVQSSLSTSIGQQTVSHNQLQVFSQERYH